MYIVNTKLRVNWTLYAQIAPPVLEDLSISEYGPDNAENGPLSVAIEDYIRPTVDTMGFITHEFTPTSTGLWRISLRVSGTIVHTQKVLISRNDTDIKKFVSKELLPG